MKLIDNYSSIKLLLIALVGSIIVSYPNIVCLPWELSFLDESKHSQILFFLGFRCLYFTLLLWVLLYLNLTRMKTYFLKPRIINSFLIAIPAYVLYILSTKWTDSKFDFISTMTCQFFVITVMSILLGHLAMLYLKQRKQEQEIEQLKIDNLQSRCNALTNQINPHFFFNSLNGIVALVRKNNNENVLSYVNTLSDVFRYTIQSDKKGLVTLKEEIGFVNSFSYMMEVRYANKLSYDIDIDESKMNLKIPVLSFLPLIDNVIMHNCIDSNHIMKITIRINDKDELIVSNPIYSKLSSSVTNGTGLINLGNRFSLMLNREIRIEDDGEIFTVYLPLK